MKIVAKYNFNGGEVYINAHYRAELTEIVSVIDSVSAPLYKNKESKEKTMSGMMLYAPGELNTAFKAAFGKLGWNHKKIPCDYRYGEFLDGYNPPKPSPQPPFRDMDFLKEPKKLGIEVQFGKYAFMVYNVCAKMTIFRNLGIIDAGVEIVPVKRFADEMSTGVSYFEQFAWDLALRGVADIDVPVLVLGIDV